MDILVFGAGAIGSFIGGKLSDKFSVTLVGRKKHVDAINSHGLKMQDIDGRLHIFYPEAYTKIDDRKIYDLIFLTVKAYDTENAGISIKKYINKHSLKTTIVVVQNGLSGFTEIKNIFWNTDTNIVACVTTHGVLYRCDGMIEHTGDGDMVCGTIYGNNKESKKVKKIFDEVKIKSVISQNIWNDIWMKTIVNACINPVTALLGIRNGELLKYSEYRHLMNMVVKECIEVADAENIHINEKRIKEMIVNVLKKTSKNKSSMLQDIEKKRKTEIESINGKIVELGKQHNIPVPVNEMITFLIRILERSNLCKS